MTDMKDLRIIGVNEQQISKFKGMVSADMTEAPLMPMTYALGAVLPLSEDGRFVPVGIIIFTVCPEEDGETPESADVEWLYVDKKMRRRGIAGSLLANAAATLSDGGIRELRCEISWQPAQTGLSSCFRAMGFHAVSTFASRIEGKVVSFLPSGPPKNVVRPYIKKLSEIRDSEIKKALQRRMTETGRSDMEWFLAHGEEWFDDAISRVSLASGRIGTMLLVHRKPSGTLWAMLLREQTETTPEGDDCVFAALGAARLAYGYNTWVEFTCARGEDFVYLAALLKNGKVEKVTRMVTDIAAM